MNRIQRKFIRKALKHELPIPFGIGMIQGELKLRPEVADDLLDALCRLFAKLHPIPIDSPAGNRKQRQRIIP